MPLHEEVDAAGSDNERPEAVSPDAEIDAGRTDAGQTDTDQTDAGQTLDDSSALAVPDAAATEDAHTAAVVDAAMPPGDAQTAVATHEDGAIQSNEPDIALIMTSTQPMLGTP